MVKTQIVRAIFCFMLTALSYPLLLNLKYPCCIFCSRTMAVAKTLVLTLLLWCTFCDASAGHTAVIWMKNGDGLTGTITQQDKDIVFLNLPYSGQVQLPRAQIERIEQQKLLPTAPQVVAETLAVVIKNQPVRHYSVDLTTGKKRSSSTDNLGFKTAFEQRDNNMRLTFDGKYDYETSNSLKKTHKYLLNPGADYFFQPQLFWRPIIKIRI